MKSLIKNITNRPILVAGTKLRLESEKIMEIEISPEIERQCKNKFFEVVEEEEIQKDEEPKEQPNYQKEKKAIEPKIEEESLIDLEKGIDPDGTKKKKKKR